MTGCLSMVDCWIISGARSVDFHSLLEVISYVIPIVMTYLLTSVVPPTYAHTTDAYQNCGGNGSDIGSVQDQLAPPLCLKMLVLVVRHLSWWWIRENTELDFKELYCNTDIRKWRQIKYLLKSTGSAVVGNCWCVCVCVCVCVFVRLKWLGNIVTLSTRRRWYVYASCALISSKENLSRWKSIATSSLVRWKRPRFSWFRTLPHVTFARNVN